VNVAMQAFELPASYPNDPVDRIIGATALIEDIPLLTADREIRKSRAVPTLW
jgi:PIN domain nuclease of toxin-antitoxin system